MKLIKRSIYAVLYFLYAVLIAIALPINFLYWIISGKNILADMLRNTDFDKHLSKFLNL